MSNRGVFTLMSADITAVVSGQPLRPIPEFDGMTAVTLEFNFQYGKGSGQCSAVVQTTLDSGRTWRDIARADFSNASGVKHCNLEGLLSKRMTVYSALEREGVNDGILGNHLRCVPFMSGDFTDTRLSVRASVR